ncbi:MAG: hypothetical protein AB7I27_18050 [Bacteriovoracaceae bacterium]
MKALSLFLISLSLISTSCSSKKHHKEKKEEVSTTGMGRISEEKARAVTASWPEQNKEVMNKLISKYGLPNESTSDSLIWNNNGPWTRTELTNQGNNQMLVQTANLDVPTQKISDLALFNKSIMVNQGQNEISSASNHEELNFLSLNLANDIVNNRIGPFEARKRYSYYTDYMGKSNYIDNLHFKDSSLIQSQEIDEE